MFTKNNITDAKYSKAEALSRITASQQRYRADGVATSELHEHDSHYTYSYVCPNGGGLSWCLIFWKGE